MRYKKKASEDETGKNGAEKEFLHDPVLSKELEKQQRG